VKEIGILEFKERNRTYTVLGYKQTQQKNRRWKVDKKFIECKCVWKNNPPGTRSQYSLHMDWPFSRYNKFTVTKTVDQLEKP